jgi:hypothetical protein
MKTKVKKMKHQSTSDVTVPKPKHMSHGMPIEKQRIGLGFSRSLPIPKLHRKAPKIAMPKINPKKASRY